MVVRGTLIYYLFCSSHLHCSYSFFFFFQAEDGIRDVAVTGVQTCALPIYSGRREINWDGVPAALTNVDTFPATFFNVNSKRGVLMSTRGTGLRVDSSAFASINAGLADQFKAFSPKKLFVAVGSNQVEADFKLAGTPANGRVQGFGVVFSDVDKAAAP